MIRTQKAAGRARSTLSAAAIVAALFLSAAPPLTTEARTAPAGSHLAAAPAAAADDYSEHARAALARMPPEAKLGEIADERLRRAAQVAYRAVSELAGNGDDAKAPALYAKFERAYAAFDREAARRGHKVCALNCRECDGEPCEERCRASGRRLCGCKLTVFGCIVAECLF
jgi:hypothetical protein